MLQYILQLSRAIGHKLIKTSPVDKDDDAMAKILTITRSYLCFRVTGDTPTKLGGLQQTRSQNVTGKNGSILSYFHCKECTEFAATLVFSSTPTQNNTLQVILKTSIFWFADPTKGEQCVDGVTKLFV